MPKIAGYVAALMMGVLPSSMPTATLELEENMEAVVFSLPVQCSPRKKLVKMLTEVFKEKPHSVGKMNNGSIIEIYRTPEGTSWTIVATGPDLWDDDIISCIITAGEAWQDKLIASGKDI